MPKRIRNKFLKFLIKKKLASDREKAQKILIDYSGNPNMKNKEVLSFDEFTKIFCKGIFKDALINVTQSFQKMKQSKDLPLTLKINEY